MSAASDTYDRLIKAVCLDGDDAAIRIRATYQAQAGPTAKVNPPTYIAAPDGTRYHLEQRWGEDGEPVDVVILDSIQSQANRAEKALRTRASELGLPQIVMKAEVAGQMLEVSTLDAPHRSRDAYFLDSQIGDTPFDQTDVGRMLLSANLQNATPYLQYAPGDLVYGVWDSHRGRAIPTKFPRSYTSEMLGWHVLRGKKAATKGDPLNLPGTSVVPMEEWGPARGKGEATKGDAKSKKLSELGHGMIPVAPSEDGGGVSVRDIVRDAVLSLNGLARYRFPASGGDADGPGRAALAALALVGDRLAFGRAGLHLRSGSDLVLQAEKLEWVRAGGQTAELHLGIDEATELLDIAVERMATAGVKWDPTPIIVHPSDRLRAVIEETLSVAELGVED